MQCVLCYKKYVCYIFRYIFYEKKSVCCFVNCILYHKKCTDYFVCSASCILKINVCHIVRSVLFYKKHAFYTARCILYPRNTLIYIIRCIYIVRNVPAIFSSTSCISNISRYQQKISFGIGQMSMLFLGKYISGFKLVNARKLTKNSKRSSNFLHAFISQKFRFCKR